MAVEPDRTVRDVVDSHALEALAEAGTAAARGGRLTDVLVAVAEGVARAAGADAALVRVVDPGRSELVVRAVSGPSASLGAELEGGRLALAELPDEETGLDGAPEAVRRVAERIDAGEALVLPVAVAGEVVASLELLRAEEPFGRAELVAARIAAAQIGLAVRAFGPSEPGVEAPPEAVRAAEDALAAAADSQHAATHLLRLALELSGAAGGVLWLGAEAGAAAGDTGGAAPPAQAGTRSLGLRTGVSFQLGEPVFGFLELVFAEGHAPSAELLEGLRGFAVRAADVLRRIDGARSIELEHERTRALLTVVGGTAEQLSVAHTLDTALGRVAELVGVERLAVYLLEDGRLTTAAARALAGPHTRAAEALLELAVAPPRGRAMLVVPSAADEVGLRDVADAVAEAGIEAAIAVPLVVAEEVIGLLCVYGPLGQRLEADRTALLAAVAGRLAIALQNARLHEQATRLGAELEQALNAEREAARQLGALYEISRAFAQSLSLDLTLEAVARTAVELLGLDAAVVRMPDARREQLLPLALHVRDERLLTAARPVLLRPWSFASPAVQRLVRGGVPVEVDAGTAVELEGQHALLVPFLEKGATAAVVPIATSADVLGSLTLLSLDPDRPVDAETVAAAVRMSGQAALAIDNARLYQQQKNFADAMQRSLLPQVRPPVEGLDIGEVYAASAYVEVGGDLYDYLALEDGRLAVVLGDVTGHGIDAAADMAMAKFVFRSLAREHPEPGDFLAAANEVVVGEIATGKFITMLYLLIDPATGRIACASAGHPPPRLVDGEGVVGSIDARGLALGVEPGMSYDEVGAELQPGGSVVLYTDGVIEARKSSELYGVERLDALLGRRYALRAEDIAASVIQSARTFTGGELTDDCAVVVLKRR